MKSASQANLSRAGFTLIELMISITALSILMAVMYSLALGMINVTRSEEAMIDLRDQARTAMSDITRQLRMANGGSLMTIDGGGNLVPLGVNPVTNIVFQMARDTDNNGVAVNQDLSLGLSPQRIITVDTNDANGDGRTTTQLVQLQADGTFTRALANNISGVVPIATAGPYFGAPAGGLVFQDTGAGIQVTLILRKRPDGVGPTMVTRLDQVVTPRN